MGIKIHKPTSAGRRNSSVQDFSDITKTKPEKGLVKRLKTRSGRNNQGIITVRHQGGGAKKLYRMVDFKREKYDIEGEVKTIEYDPNRGPRVALVEYSDGGKAYVLACAGTKVGDKVMSSKNRIEAKQGCHLPLMYIPIGLFVHNIEISPGSGGQIARGAGASAQLQTIEGDYAQLKMPSGEFRMVKKECMASVGIVSNSDYQLVRYGKAGRMRLRGIKPRVKGKNMNPVDHPHGGGEGHSPIGLKGGPKTPWGKKAMGVKTRNRKKWSNKLIVQRRKKK
jgi:large subunit ribosomal protein L2